jgi:hypothetical protein
MSSLLRRVVATLRRHPTAADSAVAAIFAVASVASYSTTLELVRGVPKLHEPSHWAIALALLAVILPLAVRRRFPLASAGAVVAAFVIGRVALAPNVPFLGAWELYITVWACWLALYTAAAHGRKSRFATAFLTLLALVLFGEVIREVYLSDAALKGLPRNQGFLLAYDGVFLV